MTQSACGYSKQRAEILFSSEQNQLLFICELRGLALGSDSLQQSGESPSRMGKWHKTDPVAKQDTAGFLRARPPSPEGLPADLPAVALTDDNPGVAP